MVDPVRGSQVTHVPLRTLSRGAAGEIERELGLLGKGASRLLCALQFESDLESEPEAEPSTDH